MMLKAAFLMAWIPLALNSRSPMKSQVEYTLHVDSTDLSGVAVELRLHNAPASAQLAAHAHQEYDDKYWRYVESLSAVDAAGRPLTITRQDSVRWQVNNAPRDLTVRYRVRYPRQDLPRPAWRPFLAPSGGLIGGPQSFLYVIGKEQSSVTVALDLPRSWRVGTALSGPPTSRVFTAPDVQTLMESPMLVGTLSEWDFRVKHIPHRIFYWRLPSAAPFDTIVFARGIEHVAAKAIDLFGSAPYRDYTFLLQDGAYGGLEHPSSVTLGAPSAELTRNPYAALSEMAHEFFHAWNLMAINPIEYRGVDYRVQPPVAGLWFSEGLTIYYADLLMRRADLPTPGATRIARLENLIQRYLSAPGNARFSAEDVSRVAYNARPNALGDYTASTHLQGELLGTVLDVLVRDATDGTRSMDDVMRLMYTRFRGHGFRSDDVQIAVEEVCSCSATGVFDTYVRHAGAMDFARYLAPIGLRVSTSWGPAVANDGKPVPDLRAWGWEEEGQPYLRLRVADPNSVWGRAGLHTDDQIVSFNRAAIHTWPDLRALMRGLAVSDTVVMVVQRPKGRFETRVVVRALDRPTVTIEPIAASTERQRRLLAGWMAAR